MTDLNTLTTKALVELHNSFICQIPGLKPVTVKTYNNKAGYISRIQQFQLLTKPATNDSDYMNPADIAAKYDLTPYQVRMKLRAAIVDKLIPGQKNTRWKLSPHVVAKVFEA
jgi:hypothetical protein